VLMVVGFGIALRGAKKGVGGKIVDVKVCTENSVQREVWREEGPCARGMVKSKKHGHGIGDWEYRVYVCFHMLCSFESQNMLAFFLMLCKRGHCDRSCNTSTRAHLRFSFC
jgi:hypothetical protein